MICVLDANVLVLWANTATEDRILSRLDHMLETIGKVGGRIVLPTPAVSELLVRTADGTSAWLAALHRRSTVVVAPFDLRAATECAMIHRLATQAGSKRKGTKDGEHYQKIKVDRQIAAIARVAGADMLITDDENLISVCAFIALPTCRVRDLELPPSAAQMKMDLAPPVEAVDRAGPG